MGKLIGVDEATISIFNKHPPYNDIRAVLNTAMNEDGMGAGWVNKVLREKTFSYQSKVTLIACTVPMYIPTIREFLGDGFLERCFMNFNDYNEDEMIKFSDAAMNLTEVNKIDVDNEMSELTGILSKWETDAIQTYYHNQMTKRGFKTLSAPFIEFDKDAVQDMKDVKNDYWVEKIKEYFSNKGQQSMLMGFFNRNVLDKAYRIAAQKAVLDLSEVIGKNEFKFGLEVSESNMESIIKILETQPDDEIKSNKSTISDETLNSVLKSILIAGEFNKTQVKKMLAVKLSGKGYGESKCLRVINDRIFKGLVEETKGTNNPNEKILKWKDTI